MTWVKSAFGSKSSIDWLSCRSAHKRSFVTGSLVQIWLYTIRVLTDQSGRAIGITVAENCGSAETSATQKWNDVDRKTTRLAALVRPKTLLVEIDRPKYGEVSTPTGVPGVVGLNALTASSAKLRE